MTTGARRRGGALAVAASLLAGTACTAAGPEPSEPTPAGPASPTPSRTTTPTAPTATPSTPASTPTRSDVPRELASAARTPPSEATSAAQVARQLTVAERAIDDPRTPPRLLAAAGHLQQVAYRRLGRHPGWDAEVRRRTPGHLHRTIADNVEARRQLQSMGPADPDDHSDVLPAWRIVAPPPAGALRSSYRAAQRASDIPWQTLAAINLIETGMGRIRGTSTAGAEGPMQFLPSTWEIYGAGGDINDPHDAIQAAGRLLDANGYARDPVAALHRYNNSGAYVRAVLLLAGVMERRPRAFAGYYHWQVYYLTSRGSVLLPEGYAETEPVPVDRWLSGRG